MFAEVGGRGNGEWRVAANGTRLLFGVMKDTLKIDHGDGCTAQ